jgi:hypothetical protein
VWGIQCEAAWPLPGASAAENNLLILNGLFCQHLFPKALICRDCGTSFAPTTRLIEIESEFLERTFHWLMLAGFRFQSGSNVCAHARSNAAAMS